MENFELKPLPIPFKRPLEKVMPEPTTNHIQVVAQVDPALAEKIKDYAYWERINQKEVALRAIQSFFQDRQVQPRPPHARQKKRGRKANMS